MMIWQDSEQTVLPFNDLIFPDEVDNATLKCLCNPKFIQNAILYGPPGTGKTVACRAIAAARTNSATFSELNTRVTIVNAKSEEDRELMKNESFILNRAQLSKFTEDNAMTVFIFDEIDFLKPTQQNQLIAAIDKAASYCPVMILATTNEMLDSKQFIPALIDRFHHKFYFPKIEVKHFVPVAQKYLRNANIEFSDEDLEQRLSIYLNSDEASFRDVRSFVNAAIMKSQM